MYTYNTSPQENIEIAKLRIGDTSLQEYINSAQAIVSSSPSSLISRIDGSNASLNIQVADANPNYSKGQVVGDTLGMLAKDIFNGLSKAFEGIADFGAGLVGTIAGAAGDKSTEQALADYVARDTTNEYVWNGMFKGTNQDFEASAINRLSETGQNIVRGTAQAVGGMIPTIAISLISRGAGASAAVASVASLAQMGVSAAGNATEEALNDVIGYDENGNEIHTTLDRAFLYGLANGAMEIATETLIGGVYEGIFGKGLLDGVVKRLVKNIKFGKIVAWLINVFGEGVEEIVGAVFDDTLRTIYNSADGKMHWKAPDLQAVIENGIIGSLTAVVMGGAQSALSRVSTKNTIGMSLQNINENNEWATNLQNKGRFDETRASNYQTDNEKQLKTIEKRLKMMSEARRAKIMSEMPQLSNYFDENGTRLEKQKLNANAAELGDLTTARQNGTYDARITDDNVVANRFGQSQQQLLENNKAKVKFTIAEDLTAEERKRYKELQKLGKNTGAKTGKPLKYVVFQADIQNQNETDLRIVNGFVIDDIMYINRENLADISKVSPEAKVWAHESSHYAEGSPEYDLLMSILKTSYPELYKQVRADVESPSSPYAALSQEKKEKEINAILFEEVFSIKTTKDENGNVILGNEYLKERIIADNSGFFAKLANRIKWTAKALKAAFSGDKATLQYIHQLELIAQVIEKTIEAGGTKLLKTRAYNRDKEDEETKTNTDANVELAPQFSLREAIQTLGEYDDIRKQRIESISNNLISRNYEDIINFIKQSIKDSTNKKLHIGIINKNVAQMILDKTNINVNGYDYVLSSNNIAHIFKKHGAEDELLRGQKRVTLLTIENLLETIISPDDVKVGNTKNEQTLQFEKYLDGKNIAITMTSSQKKQLTLVSGWIIKKDEAHTQPTNALANVKTSEMSRSSSINNNISTKNKNVKQLDNNIPFSLEIGDETINVEAEKKSNLVALHNLTEQQFLKVIELGGFPMPSIAITKADMPHDNYGGITIVFGKETIDPKASAKNVVYDKDAWTPTIPTIEIKLNREKAKGFNDYIQSLVSKYPEYRNYTGWLDNRYKNYAGDFVIKEYDFNADSMYHNAIDDAPTMAAYLSTKKGKDIKPVYREKYYSTHGFSQVSRSEAKRIIETLGIKNPVDYNNMSSEEKQKLLDKYIPYKAKQLQEQLNSKESDQPKITYEQALNHYKRDYDIGKINDLLFMANDYFHDKDDQTYDLYATKDKLKAQIDDKEDFKNWIWDKIKDAYDKKGIRNNNSVTTSSGNWRKFESLHNEYNLENIVKQMSQGKQAGATGLFMTSDRLAALLSKQFKSIKDIRESQDLLKRVSEEEEKAFKKKTFEMFSEILNDIDGKNPRDVQDSLYRKDGISDMIGEMALARPITIDSIKRTYENYTKGYNLNYNFNDTIANKILTLFQLLQKTPTTYFEAKPRRPVGLNEIKYVIIPDSSSKEFINKLNEYNIPYTTYNGQDGERSKIINQMDDIKFSLSSSRDSDGKRLTNGQVDYFKDSKVRDENGNLLAVYHGTNQKNFTIFGTDRSQSQFGKYKFGDYNVNYFTRHKDIAEGYTELGYDNGNNIYKVYLDIQKPYTIESSKSEEWRNTWKNIQDENLKKIQDEIYKDFREKWLNKTNIKAKDLDEINKTLVLLGYEIHPSIERPSQYDDRGYDKRINEYDVYYAPNNTLQGGTIAEFSYSLEDLFEKDGILDEILSEEFGDKNERFLTSDDVVRLVLFMNENKETDYDGIIIKDIRDIGSKGGILDGNTDDYITIKSSNQIKAVDNLNPTEHDDIQMSLVGMHWGDLNYGKKADTRDRMGGRGTGHFGTGFYFVSKDNYGDMNYDYDEARPIFEIDLNPYNLFKPRTNDEAYRLHDGLKDVNDASQFIDDLYFNEDVALRELDDIYDNYNREDLIKELIKFADKNGITRYVDFMYNYAVNGESLNEVLNWVINETTYRDVELYKQVKDAIEWKARKTSYLESSIRSLSGILGVDAEQLKTLIKRADYISQETNNSTSTELMKLLGYEGVGVYDLVDDGEWASPDNFKYGSVIYDLKPNTYKMTRGKIYYEMPYNVEKLYEKEFDGYKVKKVNIKEVIDKNNMLSNDNIFNRRRDVWGNNIDDYHIDTDKLVDDWSINSPIRLHADYSVIDGNHRLLAMYNDGYQFADVLVENEKGFEARQKVEKQIDEMLSHPVEEEDIAFSLKTYRDSQGNEISTNQRNYFKDTKVVDDKGNLMLVYHGTEGQFFVFNKDYSSNAFFFSNLKNMARSYGDTIMPVYLNIKKPYVVDAKGNFWNDIYDKNQPTNKLLDKLEKIRSEERDLSETDFPKKAIDLMKNYGWRIVEKKDFSYDTKREIEKYDWLREQNPQYQVILSKGAWNYIYANGLTDFLESYYDENPIYVTETTREIVSRIQHPFNKKLGIWEDSNKYDGIIIKNVIDYGKYGAGRFKSADIYIAFEPNQIKDINNMNPTDDDDIRFSLKNNNNTFTFENKDAWSGAVNVLDGYIEETHSYREAKHYDFNHSLYFSEPQVIKMDEGESCFFYVDEYGRVIVNPIGRVDLSDKTKKMLEDRIKEQIKIKDNLDDIRFSLSNDNRPIVKKTKKDVEKAASDVFFYDERNHKDMFGVLSKEEATNIAREIVKIAPTIPANMIDKFCDDIADDIVERMSYDDMRMFDNDMYDIADLKRKKKASNQFIHSIKFSDNNKQEIKFRADKDGYMNILRKYSAKKDGMPLDVAIEYMYDAIEIPMPDMNNENDLFFEWLDKVDNLDRTIALSQEEVKGRYTRAQSNMTEEQKDAVKENIRERLVDALTPIVDNAKLVRDNILAEEKAKLQEQVDKKYNEKVKELKDKAKETEQKNRERLNELIEQARNTAAKSVEKKTKDILENTQKVVDRAHEDVLKVKEENSLMKKKFRALKSITKKAVFFRKESLKKYPDSSMLGDEGVEQAISVLSRLAAYGYAGGKAGRQIIADYIAKFYNPDNERIADWFDKDLYDDLVEIANNRTKTTKSGKVMNNGSDLSYEEIRVIEKMIRNAEHIVKTYNKLLIDGQYHDIDEKSREAVGTMKKYKAMMSDAKMARIFRVFVANSIEPRVVIKWLFGMQDNVLSDLYEDIAKGETKAQAAELHFAKMLQEFYRTHKKYGKTLSQKITFRGHTMTKAQLLTLIKYFEQDHSRQAVESTGWAIKNEKTKNYELADGLIDTDSLISEEELVDLSSRFDGQQLQEEIDNLKAKHKEERVKAAAQEMYDLLTEDDKAYLETISDIMEEAAKLQIETDILFKGYSDINPETSRKYLPIRRYGMDRAIDSFQAVVDSMKVDQAGNQSISKQRVKNAKRLELLDIDVLALDYFHKLGVYYGLAVPIKEFQRAYNFNTSHNMNKPISIRNTIVQDVWSYANDYIQKLLGDIQGFDRGKSIGSKALSKLRSAYVVASLGLNIKVMLTQFASYPTAFSILRASSLAKAFTRRVSFKEMDKYSEYADVRNALGDATRAEGADNTQNKIARAMMFMIQKVDRFTIGMIWNACQFEVESKHKGDATYKFGTEENKKEAAELLEQVSRRTQPNYTTTERTGIQRSNSEIVRWTLGSFTSVPSKMLSRLVESSLELRALWYKEHKLHEKVSPEERKAVGQKFIKSVTAVTMSNLMYVLIAQAMKFAMDKDRKKDKDGNEVSWWEDMLIDFGGVSAGMIPMFKDLYQTFVQGYDFGGETFSTSAISDLIDLSQDFVNLVVDTADGKAFSTNKMNGLIRNLAYALSTMTGIPLKNVYNQLYGFVKRFDASAAYQMNSVFYSTSNYSKDLKKATEDGDTDLANTIMGLMLKDKGITKLSDKVTDKIRSLYEKGFNVLPRTIGDSVTIDGEEYPLSAAQQKQIKSVYDEANAKVDKLIDGQGFNSLDEKVQAKAIKWIYDYYYEYAVAKTLGLTADSKKLLYGETMSVERFALAISVCSSLTSDTDKKGNKIANSKKNKIVATLRQAGMSRAEREMVLAYLGYSVDESIITRYIRSLGLSKNQQKIFKSYVSFAAAA